MVQAARQATGEADRGRPSGHAPPGCGTAWEQAAYAVAAWAYVAPFLWVAPFLAAPPLWIASFAQAPERSNSNQPLR